MTQTYDVRPNLESYDALTIRGIAKFALIFGALVGVQLLADRFGMYPQLHIAIQIAWIIIGIKVMLIGGKALITGKELPDQPAGPRYSQTDLRFASQRMLAIAEIAGGALLIADSIYKLFEFLPE